MGRINRTPEEIDVIKLYEAIARKKDFNLTKDEDQTEFLKTIKEYIDSTIHNSILVHGIRVENMFEYVAASLMHTKLIKREDSGPIYSSEKKVLPPDFRLFLADGAEMLIEVKNCNKTTGKIKLTKNYVKALSEYAKVCNKNLFIALFWSKWKRWTLLEINDFDEKTKYEIDFLSAYKKNKMYMIGDKMIATVPPLKLKISIIPQNDPSENKKYKIKSISIYAGVNKIEDKQEIDLALYFIFYCNWNLDIPPLPNKHKPLDVEFISNPSEFTEGQNFQMLGNLSSMISNYYNNLTTHDSIIEKLIPQVDSDTLGIIIPQDYEGKKLPLWRFTIKPE